MLATALFVIGLAQTPGIPLTSGDPNKLNYIIHKRLDGPPGEADGGGTEFARFDISVSLEPVADMEPKIEWRSMCINACQGPPPEHKDHSACDRLCDRPCGEEHTFEGSGGATVTPLTEFRPGELSETWRFEYGRVMSAAASRGMSWPGFGEVLAAVKDFTTKTSKRRVAFDVGHLVRTPHVPCGYQEWILNRRKYSIVLSVTVTRMAVSKDGGAPVPAGKLFDNHKIVCGETWQLDNEPTALLPGVDCACEKKHRTATGSSPPRIMFGSDFKVLPNDTRTATYPGLSKEAFARSGGYSIVGESMNAVNVSFSGDGMRALFLPAGTRLVPDDSNVQELVVVEDAEVLGPIVASMSGLAPVATRVRVLCAEIKKKEPTPKTKFAVAYPRDPALRRLARLTADTRFKGPWDQARVWILTDEASLDDINKRMLPPIGKATYVRLLHDVLSGPLLGSKAKKLAAFLKPEFLSELNPDEDSADWAIKALLDKDAKAAVAALRGRAAAWLKDSNFGKSYLGIVVSELVLSDSPDVRRAAREILLKDVPQDLRDEVLRSMAVDAAVMGLLSKSEDEIGEWLDVIEAYGAAPAKNWLEALAKAGPSEKLRKRAAAMLE